MIYDLTTYIYRAVALITLVITIFYLHHEISMFLGVPIEYFALASTFSLDKILVALALALNIGAFGEFYAGKIADFAGGLLALLLFGDFLINPFYEILPRAYVLWLFYILIGISFSYIFFLLISLLESFVEKWYDDDFSWTTTDNDETTVDDMFKEMEKQLSIPVVPEAKIALPHSLEGKVDPLFMDIAYYVIENRYVSTSSIQRNFNFGYIRAGRIINQLQKAGVIEEQNKPYNILMNNVKELENVNLNIGD